MTSYMSPLRMQQEFFFFFDIDLFRDQLATNYNLGLQNITHLLYIEKLKEESKQGKQYKLVIKDINLDIYISLKQYITFDITPYDLNVFINYLLSLFASIY